MRNLSHPNIVSYYGCSVQNTTLYLVLELVENGSLTSSLKQYGAFPEKLVSVYTKQLLQGCAYLHERGVVHCDIKAANLLTTKTGQLKLTDFGVSTWVQKEKNMNDVSGSPFWMAPEVIEMKGNSPSSDIWSVGCTVIELFTGSPPYFDVTCVTAMFKVVEDDHPPLPPNASPEMIDFLLRCFIKEPENRPTASELFEQDES